MKNIKNIYIHQNGNDVSAALGQDLEKALAAEFTVQKEFNEQTDLLVCIGGDGTFLRMLRQYDFPPCPIVGIHTGHLGFFQEFLPGDIQEFIHCLKTNQFSIQEHKILETEVRCDGQPVHTCKSINDVAVRGSQSQLVHLELSIGTRFIEHFSGDGLLVSTPAGSTAYNYSLGGSIIDPRGDVLQITPVAPMNTKVFRSFTSSLLLPSSDEVHICCDAEFGRSCVLVADGDEHVFSDLQDIKVRYNGEKISLMRRFDYDFWATVKSKFF